MVLKYLVPESFVSVVVFLAVFATDPPPYSPLVLGLIVFLFGWIIVMLATFTIIWRRIHRPSTNGTESKDALIPPSEAS